jgi:hypothetical protein
LFSFVFFAHGPGFIKDDRKIIGLEYIVPACQHGVQVNGIKWCQWLCSGTGSQKQSQQSKQENFPKAVSFHHSSSLEFLSKKPYLCFDRLFLSNSTASSLNILAGKTPINSILPDYYTIGQCVFAKKVKKMLKQA